MVLQHLTIFITLTLVNQLMNFLIASLIMYFYYAICKC